jgi:DNA-binding PadR family transcriptional regulator
VNSFPPREPAAGLPQSLYHAVDRLSRDELITPAEISRAGRRPERTVYEIIEGRETKRNRRSSDRHEAAPGNEDR